jgi:hypothetical protein
MRDLLNREGNTEIFHLKQLKSEAGFGCCQFLTTIPCDFQKATTTSTTARKQWLFSLAK